MAPTTQGKPTPPDPAPARDPHALTGPTPPPMPPLPLPKETPAKVDAAKVETARVLAMHAKTPTIKVEAIAVGYYNDKLRRVGDVFLIRDLQEFSETWMVRADAHTTERQATAAEAQRQRADTSSTAHDVNRPTNETDNPLDA